MGISPFNLDNFQLTHSFSVYATSFSTNITKVSPHVVACINVGTVKVSNAACYFCVGVTHPYVKSIRVDTVHCKTNVFPIDGRSTVTVMKIFTRICFSSRNPLHLITKI